MSSATRPQYEEELQLVSRCADGEDAAWRALLDQYGAFLSFVIRRALSGGGRIPSADEVDDIRNEVLAWLVKDDGRVLRTYRGESKLTSWLGVVVGRRARRIARKGEGIRRKSVSFDALTADATTHLAVETRSDTTPRHEALVALSSALEQLPARDRLLLKGAFYEKRSYAELAEEIGVRTDSVGQLLYRAKKKLKKHLGGTNFLEKLSGCVLACLSLLVRG